MSYKVEMTSGARRDLKRLDKKAQGQILNAIDALGRDPFGAGNDVKKMAGTSSTYRLRVGNFRVIYELSQRHVKITVIEVAHRREAYR
ncbi:type II toxin-antitoxin system RelE family toxin [Streptomyces sp. NBC_01803]|uniref:type II toxin-antitoxin system RelE family toxin n=1 Tax=Streptomyces sp. NBC_01803 TaxID=2975946 RepID=UPI002DDB9E2A|nr:type II toxin-antitoxin system RelE/ParE family toxin [Streptomyces sp. NBC_01803]WSA44553.1 type II toxin-antitoxin system RelE/ParE family toxin [Streptomyces sp. NBC_01803]